MGPRKKPLYVPSGSGLLPDLSKISENLKKFSLQTYKIGKDGRKQRFKFPNLDYAKRESFSRQMLHYNFSFHGPPPKIRKKTLPIPKPRDFHWKEWFKEVKLARDNRTFSERRLRDMVKGKQMRPKREVIESRKIHGFPEGLVDKFPLWKRCDDKYSTDENINVPETNAPAPSSPTIVDIKKTPAWQCEHWMKPLAKDFFSVEVNEICSNMRVLGISKDKLVPPLTLLYLEHLRKAFFNQDWLMVAKCIEGICTEASSPAGYAHRRHWTFWNAGFHSIVRFEGKENVLQAASAVRLFASNFDGMFSPRCYPRRLGVEMAIWLTQEGYFLEALAVLDEMDELGSKNPHFSMNEFIATANPKRDMIDLVANLIRAIHLYAIWKRDCKSVQEDTFYGSEDDLRRTAENALSAFEGLLELITKCEGEITSFLNQLIELTVECRSASRAKELFDEIVVKYYGNTFVEEAYVKFLKEYFPEDEDEIADSLKLKRKLKFTNPSHWRGQGRAISQYRHRMAKESTKKHFVKLQNPGYSW